ncbi:MAG: cytochrome [Nonomuraea muscovyensis]|nr:cytochrome [Nonomuraea muscovyensis]
MTRATSTALSSNPTKLAMEIVFKAPNAVADPYPYYRRLRELAPRCRLTFDQGVALMLTSYDDCHFALTSPHMTHGEQRPRLGDHRGQGKPRTMMYMDGEPHARQRGLVAKALTPRRVGALKDSVAALVDELLDGLEKRIGPGGGEVELVDAFTFRLPVAVIGRLVGVPDTDWEMLRTLTRRASASLEMLAPPDVLRASDEALQEMEDYFGDLLRKRQAEPRDDLMSALAHVEENGERLAASEITAVTVLLFGAGFQTATDAIGNGVTALAANPDQERRLREHPELLKSATEELLRYENPPHLLGRYVHDDTVWPDGTELKAGQHLLIMLGAANRDPARFDDPERLDLGRFAVPEPPAQTLSFAWGPHHCLGIHLARMELQLAYQGLLSRFSKIEVLDEELKWRESNFRGLHELNVRLTPA